MPDILIAERNRNGRPSCTFQGLTKLGVAWLEMQFEDVEHDTVVRYISHEEVEELILVMVQDSIEYVYR